ncbi:MAG: hypothetical protein D6713_04595 [Deltaproteobacteria bacterium]|nr:MAG: hypothetical protein D6713_04595 [Deltaproteobacteria bacterium]
MNLSISSTWFILLIIVSAGIAVSYYVGYRKNLTFIRESAAALEKALKPKDQTYTWLGGVIGFSGEFAVKGFNRVHASLFTLPRQSLLYFPIALFTTGYDRLDVLFYLRGKAWNEVHALRRRGGKKIKIYNRDLLREERVTLGGEEFTLLYRMRNRDVDGLLELAERISGKGLVHMALTPEKSVLYVRLKVDPRELGQLEDAISAVAEAAPRFAIREREKEKGRNEE